MYQQSITKAQRKALKRVYDRTPLYDASYMSGNAAGWQNRPYSEATHGGAKRKTYREFRKSVVHSFGCLMLPWCGMWLGIESDGYTHS